MSFKKEQLLPGENLIAQVHQHSFVLIGPILLNIVSAGVFIALSFVRWWFVAFDLVLLAYLAWEIVVRQRREYILTDRRVVQQEGVFSLTSFDASLDKINNVFHEQTLFGRLFKYGTVGFETASEQGTTVCPFIPDPVRFKNQIVQQREMYKSLPPAPGAAQNIPKLLEELASLRDRNIISHSEFEQKKQSLLSKI
jgi:uncharacterized membrane protein YdbT with pleckstrin-like domain